MPGTALKLVLVLAIALPLAGCSAFKKLTGKGNDNTVLSGQREDVLPPDAQTAQDPKVLGKQSPTDCKPDDPTCLPPPDQDATVQQ
jgi:hypothetical protein